MTLYCSICVKEPHENQQVVSITLPPNMVAEAKELARQEKRTMSELMREAFRRYKRQREWTKPTRTDAPRRRKRGSPKRTWFG